MSFELTLLATLVDTTHLQMALHMLAADPSTACDSQNSKSDIVAVLQQCAGNPFLIAARVILGPAAGIGFVIYKLSHERTESMRAVIIEGIMAFLSVEALIALGAALMR